MYGARQPDSLGTRAAAPHLCGYDSVLLSPSSTTLPAPSTAALHCAAAKSGSEWSSGDYSDAGDPLAMKFTMVDCAFEFWLFFCGLTSDLPRFRLFAVPLRLHYIWYPLVLTVTTIYLSRLMLYVDAVQITPGASGGPARVVTSTGVGERAPDVICHVLA
ncbi:hypothetical protein NDU88_006221 [Pleurodeles waltl]|uniref:Uncharacterized protein n=1 Tax=Pleurodeles waltl TaxID=8319 RepID=A0AAV7TEH6_PLEWA|nr:hypothetical protein NDU88_006221 [Pleurodeles waltl]